MQSNLIGKMERVSLVVAMTLGAALFCSSCGDKEESSTAKNGELREVPVVTARVELREFIDGIALQGNVEAKNKAMVPVRVPGTIDALYVDEGDDVVAKKTKLFRVDSVKLKKAKEISEQDLAVAESNLTVREADLERATADFDKASLDYERFKKLLEDGATTQYVFEQQESRYKQVKAVVKQAEAAVKLAEDQKTQAELALAIAKKNLSDALVYAPIDGKISARYLDLGEMGGAGSPVFRIDDPSLVEISAFLPAQYYSHVVAGKTEMSLRVGGEDAGSYKVTYKSPTIDVRLRTFEVKCEIKDPPEGVVPGSMADITIVFSGHKGLGVPRASLVQRTGSTIIFLVDGGKADLVEVETGLETGGWIEVKGEGITADARVVTMGQTMLRDGDPVDIQKETR